MLATKQVLTNFKRLKSYKVFFLITMKLEIKAEGKLENSQIYENQHTIQQPMDQRRNHKGN